MKSHRRAVALLAALAGSAFAAEGRAQGVTFDSTALQTPPHIALPARRLTLKAFEPAALGRTLVQAKTPLKAGEKVGDRELLENADFHVERELSTGSLLVAAKAPKPVTGAPVRQNDALLQRKSLARLTAFGIPQAEVGRVLQRRAYAQDADGDGQAVGEPEVFHYKTYVLRAVGGVPVVGHRAVITHGADGSFVRALVRWPALAATGHRLRTTLTVPAIEKAAATALEREGVTSGKAKLRWRLVPTQAANGEVALTLKVAARVPGGTKAEAVVEEPREIEVEVQAQ